MSKTPVSQLQEFMIKRCMVPDYKLLPSSEGIGTHIPTFFIKVTAGSVSAIGKGRSKKDAKHEAARLAMEQLLAEGLPGTQEMIPQCFSPNISVTSDPPSPSKIQVNAMGALHEYCAEKNIPLPNFEIIADIGPPHLREFTAECRVATMTVSATELTKKKAKQSAAQKMLHRLMDALPEEIEGMHMDHDTNPKAIVEDDDNEAIKTYFKVSKFAKRKVNFGLKIRSFPGKLKDLMEELDITYKQLWADVDSPDEIELVLNRLQLNYSVEFMQQKNSVIAFFTLFSEPDFVNADVASSAELAKKQVYKRTYDFLQNMTT